MEFILLTDLHLGTRNASMTWWKSQMDFLEKQLLPDIQARPVKPSLICLGDVFDTRSSVSVFIMHEAKKYFERLAEYCNEIYIVCGNHDTYSEQTSEYCSLDLVFAGTVDNIKIVSQEILELPQYKAVLIPWHAQKERGIVQLSRDYKGKYIFTHSDIIMGNPKLATPVFSGHVHSPYINGNVRNLGSCFSLNFNDTDADRYYYVWDSETDDLKRIANTQSIHFWRIRNDEVLDMDFWASISIYDYIEIYIKASLLADETYQQICKTARAKFKNCWVIPLPDELNGEAIDIDCDMEGIIKQSIPDDLKERFEYIKQKINERTEQEF